MRRSASEIIRNLEMRIARLERQAHPDDYKTITKYGNKMYFATVTGRGSFVKYVSYEEWSKSNLPDQSSPRRRNTLKRVLLYVARKRNLFDRLSEVIPNPHYADADFFKIMDWLDKNGIKVTARGIQVSSSYHP